MVLYVPGTEEIDPKKQNMSLQQLGAAIAALQSGTVTTIASNSGPFTLTGGITNSANAIKLALNNASFQSATLSPTGTASVAGVMMGLGSTCTLTPVYSTRIKLEFYGTVSSSIASAAQFIAMKYGTGAAPANGVAAVGTGVGSQINAQVQSAAFILPFALSAVITGLTPTTAYWFDLFLAVSAGTSTIASLSCNAMEF